MTLEQLKQTVEKKYKLYDTKGVFLSCFDSSGKLLLSKGVVQTSEPLEHTLEVLYHTHVAPLQGVKILTVDIVTTFFEETNTSKIPTTSPKMYGFALVDEHGATGTILPGTKGVADAKHALYLIKQKYAIQGKVQVYLFTTDRLLVTE